MASPTGKSNADETPPQSRDLSECVRAYIELDDNVRDLKKSIKATSIHIKELSLKKRQLGTIIANIMGEHEIDTLDAQLDGRSVGRISRVFTKRAKPTVAALEKTIVEKVFKGNRTKFEELQKEALTHCKPAIATIRRSTRAATRDDDDMSE